MLARTAFADSPSATDANSGGDWELETQVLEIPQACTNDGGVLSCEVPKVSIYRADPSEADNAADDATGGPGSAAAGASESTLDDAAPNDEFGTLEDYESQGDAMGPVVSTARVIGPVWRSPLQPLAYAPAPTAISGPIVPTRATSPFGSGPWLVPPSVTWGHPAGAPMMVPGRAFRIR